MEQSILESTIEKDESTAVWHNHAGTSVMLQVKFSCPKSTYQRQKWGDNKTQLWCDDRDVWTGRKLLKTTKGVDKDCLSYFADQEKVKEGILKTDEALETNDFQSMSAEDLAIKYFINRKKTDPGKVINPTSNADWKNSGSFSDKGVLSEQELNRIRAELKENEGIIFHGVISVRHEYNNEFHDQNDGINFMKKYLPKLFKDNNWDPDNMQFVGALHCNTDNRHIHFMAYQKEVDLTRTNIKDGVLREKTLEECREHAVKFISGETDAWKPLRTSLNKEFRAVTQESQDSALYNQVRSLASILPKRGHLQYNRKEILPYRQRIFETTQNIINLFPEFRDKNNQIMDVYHDKRKNSPSKASGNWYDKILNEYQGELCNTVLGLVKKYNEEDYAIYQKSFSNPRRKLRNRGFDEPNFIISKAKNARKQSVLFSARQGFHKVFHVYLRDMFSRSMKEIEYDIQQKQINATIEFFEDKYGTGEGDK
jgi:hypothetical protein